MTSRMNQIGQNGNDGLHYEHDADLTWLARNVHEWEEGSDSVIMTSDKTIVEFVSRDNKPAFYTGPFFTKNQWLTRRVELQNKPNWEDAPEWAEFLTQDENGEWTWFEYPCEIDKTQWNEHADYNGLIKNAGDGQVLGDWCNTLEKRPEKREHNPPTSNLHHGQAVARLCSDGRPCGEVHEFCQDAYCDDCPNDPLADLKVSVKPTAHSQAKQARYQDSTGDDWIDECARTMTPEEFRGAMKFTIGKYIRRAGKKDDLVKEIAKIEDYARRWGDYERGLLE